MKAAEARQIADSQILKEFWNQYDKVMGEIRFYSLNGYHELKVFYRLSDTVIAHLKELGYAVDKIDQCEIKITW